jgi:hypothetical protein
MRIAVSPKRVAAVLLMMGGVAVRVPAQSGGLPATPPTTAPVSPPAPNPAPAPAAPVVHDAKVVYRAGMLEITANGSSLNQILRDIARQTGMRISGGLTEERVYGSYGPAPMATVLASLIEGTGVNMVFRETSGDAPAELSLTPKNGALTPPSFYPSAPSGQAANWVPPQQQGARPAPAPQVFAPPPMATNADEPAPQPPPPDPGTPAPPADPTATVATPVAPPTVAPADPTATANDPPASPNGVKTPQQIYMQLQQMQQQQQANPR